jgi:hypothetical protein
MVPARYVLAVVAGLAVGVAIGWFSDRATHTSRQAARGHHHSGQVVNLGGNRPHTRTPHSSPPPPQSRRAPAVTLRQLQQQMLACLYAGGPGAQTACMRGVVRRELRALGSIWSPQAGGGDGAPQPFLLIPSQG